MNNNPWAQTSKNGQIVTGRTTLAAEQEEHGGVIIQEAQLPQRNSASAVHVYCLPRLAN